MRDPPFMSNAIARTVLILIVLILVVLILIVLIVLVLAVTIHFVFHIDSSFFSRIAVVSSMHRHGKNMRLSLLFAYIYATIGVRNKTEANT